LIAASPVPVGTVPIYQMLEELGARSKTATQHSWNMVEHQARKVSTTYGALRVAAGTPAATANRVTASSVAAAR